MGIKDCKFFFNVLESCISFHFIKEEGKNLFTTPKLMHKFTCIQTQTLTQPYIFWNMSVTANDKNEVAQVAP